jgi:hypothetical protein
LRRATGAFCRNPRRGGTDDRGFTGNRPFRDAAVILTRSVNLDASAAVDQP